MHRFTHRFLSSVRAMKTESAMACAESPAVKEARFVTVTMSDGSVMKAAVDGDGCTQAQASKVGATPQIASMKALQSSVRSILGGKQDDVALNILMYVINNEPVSVYRVAKTVPYNFSLTYKKANKLLREGLVRQIPAADSKDHRCRRLFESTVKGLLTAWNQGYMEDREVYESLKKKWSIGAEDLSKLDHVFKLLPSMVSGGDTAIFQDLFLLAAAASDYENCRMGTKNGQPPEVDAEAKRYASRYVLAKALKKVSSGRMVVFASADYAISYEADLGKTFVYNCSLCDRCCCMTEVPPRSQKCDALEELLTSFSLRTDPRA